MPIPGVHKIDIQQGNVITQEMVDKLKPGMTKNQVKFVLGTPAIADAFHQNRWDYVYSLQPGGGERQQQRLTLFFDDDKLTRIEGDVKPAAAPSSPPDGPAEAREP
jgi:outer membrane protein assembly factor BamE